MTGQPSTPDEIRSLYVEALARAEFAHFCKTATWEEIDESDRQTWIPNAERLVDALAEKGLMPTVARWKTSGGGGDTPGWWPDKASAVAAWDQVQKKCAEMCEGDWVYEAPTLKREYTTGWTEVPW